jgi:hypothetical protein
MTTQDTPMTEERMREIMYKTVATTCAELSKLEVGVLYMAVVLKNGGIKNVMGYDKVSHLFNQAGGTKMHEETERAFLAYASQRLEEK